MSRAKRWWTLIVFVTVVALTGWGIAQAQSEQEMEEMMKFATPNEHHAHLEKLVGTWKAQGKFWRQAKCVEVELAHGRLQVHCAYRRGGRVGQHDIKRVAPGIAVQNIVAATVEHGGETAHDHFCEARQLLLAQLAEVFDVAE